MLTSLLVSFDSYCLMPAGRRGDIERRDPIKDGDCRVAKSDLNSTEAYFATQNYHKKMAQK